MVGTVFIGRFQNEYLWRLSEDFYFFGWLAYLLVVLESIMVVSGHDQYPGRCAVSQRKRSSMNATTCVVAFPVLTIRRRLVTKKESITGFRAFMSLLSED